MLETKGLQKVCVQEKRLLMMTSDKLTPRSLTPNVLLHMFISYYNDSAYASNFPLTNKYLY